MAAQFYKINYKSDFVLTINSDAGWAVPFCIKFWTGMPSHGYFAGFDGENYVNCRVGDEPTQLLVMFDDHHMPVGPLRMQIAYHTTIEEFPDRKFDEVTNPTNVTVDIDGTEYQVMLDFTGETGAEIDFSMPSSGVMSVNGKIGYVTLNAEDVGAQPTIEDLATIRSGAAAGATAVQPAALQEGLATKQDTISDLATIRNGAAAGATAVQPATLQEGLATKQDTISDLATIRSGAAAGATAVQPAALQEGLATKQDVISDLSTIRSGAAAGATAVQPAALTPIESDIDAIEGKIPSAASTSNQLADKAFVNSALADKADTSDIPTALSQLSQDSTHRVVTDAEKSTWNGKQNAISDLATIRSGAAAGATAVQPAAMNTALAAKQDTLTFDNAPTANSNNPVKSSGIKTALDAKQSTISTVNVTVDNNTGTPSGSASVSGSTLSLSFQNLKGATGATGATGPQGPQGERGLPGESGVTGDVSGFTVIQTIDPSATYGATDIAGAAALQAANAELTELEGEVDWKDEGANQFDVSNASFTIQYSNFIQASKSGDTITISAKKATGSNVYVCGISPFTPTSGEKYILSFDYVNTCGEAVMPNLRTSANAYIDVFRDESQNNRTIPVGSGSVEWEFTAPANVGILGITVTKNTSVGNGVTLSNIKLYQPIDVPLNQKVAELATNIQDVEDEMNSSLTANGANIFNLNEKTLGVYDGYTNVWAPSQSGDTATWTVATKQNHSYTLYVSPVVLTEGKKYHIKFNYVNQAASAVLPSLRTSDNVYIDVIDSIPLGSGTYNVEIISPANVGILGFSANANVAVGSIFSVSNIEIREIKNIADLTEDCINSIESINDEISEINGILKPSGVVTLEQGLWQNGAKVSPSSASQRVRTNDLLKCPLSLSVNSGYNILRVERYDADKNLVSSDWVSSGRTEVELRDLGYATFSFNNTSNTAISPSENIISDYTAGLEMLFKSDAISTDSLDMPLLGYGRKVISKPTETYCHNPIVRETPEYIFVCYQSSTGTTYEDSQNHFQHILLSINKRSGKKRYVTLFADADAETIDGNTISYVYNQSICPLSDTTLLIRTGCNLNDKWQLIYKVYDATADTLTDAAISQISYNSSTVDFTCANYMTMCNTLYSAGETVIEKPYTLDIAGMWKDGSTIYTLMALKNAWVLMTSTDGITWTPVACPYVKVPSETEICVYNSKIYYVCRAQSQSQIGYFVTDLSGTILKEWTTVSTVMTKPYITACGGKVFIMYNISSGVSKFYGRNKAQFAEVNTSTYALTNIRTYASRNGYNYYCIAPTTTENLIFVNVEDCRGLNYSANRNCTNDVNIAYIELLE